jgi:hypothetical protein
MIIREIRLNPQKEIVNFDWFNDYIDTRDWAYYNCPNEIVVLLDKGYAAWLHQRNQEMLKGLQKHENLPR